MCIRDSLEDLRACNVELVSFSEGLDFTTTTGNLLYQVLSAFAEFERDCIRERVRAGMRNARAKGKRIGRPPRTQLSLEDVYKRQTHFRDGTQDGEHPRPCRRCSCPSAC